MAYVNYDTNRETLDTLRIIRSRLYAIPESELNAMSLDDQVKYGDSLHQVAIAVLKLERAKLHQVNEEFKEREKELKDATVQLEQATSEFSYAVKVIRVISDGLGLIQDIINLLS